MFHISHKTENGFHITTLSDDATGCYAEILPASGATLHKFGIRNKERDIQVIDHYTSRQQFQSQLEPLGYKGCKLSPFVCRLENNRYTFGDKKFEFESRDSQKHGLHGLLYMKSFDIISEEANELHASVTMKYAYRGEDPGFPFHYDCVVTYKLAADCKIHVRTECLNTSDGLMPLQDGWHPYFDLGAKVDTLELEFQSLEEYIFNDELLPTGGMKPYQLFGAIRPIGEMHLDNSFTLDMQECQPLCVLRNKETGVEVQIFPTPSYPVLQVYTPDHRKSLSLENLSGPPNAFNLGKGFITLEAGQSATFETAYRIHINQTHFK